MKSSEIEWKKEAIESKRFKRKMTGIYVMYPLQTM